VRIRHRMPKGPSEWLEEIARAYLDAREAIPYGNSIGQTITDKDLYHMAPAVCLKFRGVKKSKKVLEEATMAALTSYSVMQKSAGELLDIPQISFAFCYLASHFGLNLIDEDAVNSVMEFVVTHQGVLMAGTTQSAEQ
jgi:hypothetical protein